ncbi:hypothetical protein ACFYTQ_15475 [Nocardia sp. NPDC004068]|uniref:hypothetical protein n=1 Tax=Nocardia sp. NPDC004068 TaxID=3364303 RepID=UPI0036A89FBC
MAVPLPDDRHALRVPPDDAEVEWTTRGIIAAVTGPGGLTQLQRLLIAAVIRSLTGRELDVPALEADLARAPLTPEAFAHGLARRDLAYRGRTVQIMVLAQLVLDPPVPEVARQVARFAAELSVHDDLEAVLAEQVETGRRLVGMDFDRNGYLRDFDPATAPHLHVSSALNEPWSPVENDPALAARWESLGALPSGTLGRGVHDFYRARGFAFPGAPGSAPPLLAQHDWVHVLADYGTRVESEIEVFAFIARANDDLPAFSLLAMVIGLFETGQLATGAGLFQADRGHLSQPGMTVRMADALRRGALCRGSIDFLALDWFALADRPVDVVRGEVELPPKDATAVRAGSVGPWDRGGISPFQANAGRQLAAAQGREYRGPEV